MARPLYEIASDIRKTWRNKQGKSSVYFGAVPYLDAMRSLDSVSDTFGYDDGKSVVTYFLSNATTWRGDDARRIKAELKALLH